MAHSPATDAPRRPRSRQGTGARLRDELIEAATRLLGETGEVEGLSLRAVAREVGIAAPSVYLHFASKEELFGAVLAEQFDRLRRAIEEASAQETDPAAKLRAGCLAYCRFATERPGAYRILFGAPRRGPEGSAHGEIPGTEAFATLVDGIAACMRDGAARPGDPLRVATDLWAALHGIVGLRRSLPTFPWPPLEEQVTSLLVGLAGVDFATGGHRR